MFENRLRWFAIIMLAMALIIIVRLVDIQVVRADSYEQLADRLLTRPITFLAAPRGSILDRNGRVLVSDAPASGISVHFEIIRALAAEPDAPLPVSTNRYLSAVASELRRDEATRAASTHTELMDTLAGRIPEMLTALADLTGKSEAEVRERADAIVARVERVKQAVQRRRPTVRRIKEEEEYHPLFDDVAPEAALAVQLQLEGDYPWLWTVPTSRRTAHDADSLVHVLGRVGAASPDRIERDPLAGTDLRALRAGDRTGITGVERLCELTLRGTRGRIVEEFDHTEIERVEPIRGNDVILTIDSALQDHVQAILHQAANDAERAKRPFGGAAAVVLDAQTREVLALASYPAYQYDEYERNYAQLIRDNRLMPTRFRAVANMYPPGSTCKVIALYGGLAEGVITESSVITCRPYFRENLPNAFRCWIFNRYRQVHGPQRATDAIRNSCNLYFYTVGDRLGIDRLCHWFTQFGLGRTQGTGLIEETAGIVPTTDWIRENRTNDPTPNPADAWNFSIGQGEVSATPLQCANVAAAVATGRWEPVKFARDTAGNWLNPRAASPVNFDERRMQSLRAGMWQVVNERGATAYKYARIDTPGYVLCGKTGSAQASRRVVRKKYIFEHADGTREDVIAPSLRIARDHFDEPQPKLVRDSLYELYPPRGASRGNPSHAWFIAYTQRDDTPTGARPRGRNYAIAVIIEFGESGGAVAGPVAKLIAEAVLADG